ncbi:MAG: hypothetical protein EOP22_14175 [Hyphomicrobiales bacterium]|nr:MAG: hypothetical protein EOP22_14175 [Hyphomicrobiales bacterium]
MLLRTGVFAFLLTLIAPLGLAQVAHAQEVGGYTNMAYDYAHGTQVEYLATNGKSWLWYPGNDVILEGRWKRQGGDMCFAYGANTYNPATGHRGGGFECMEFAAFWGSIMERMPGDIFSLATRTTPPFKLNKERTKLEKLLARVSPCTKPPPVEITVNVTRSKQEAWSCESVIANQSRSKADMGSAASTYFHGTFMGKPCVKVDYDRAFELARKSGLGDAPFLKILRARAATGNPKAIAALKRHGP